MDSNETRFHLLLGRDDWERCVDDGEPLSSRWSASPPLAEAGDVAWDANTDELTLRPRLFLFVAAATDTRPTVDLRRGVGADRFGNFYWIDDDRRRIRVRSVGSGRTADFWSGESAGPPPVHGDFAPVSETAVPPPTLCGLAVTEDHYLAAGITAPERGLLVFDLFATGEPTWLRWPDAVPFDPFDMAPRPGGGVWILDRTHRRYWGLDRRFRVIADDQHRTTLRPAQEDTFQPVLPEARRFTDAVHFPEGLTYDAASPVDAVDAIAIEALPDGSVLILDRAPGLAFSRVLRYRFQERLGEGASLASVAAQIEEGENASFALPAHDFVYLPRTGTEAEQIVVASADGNQAFAFRLTRETERWALQPLARCLPLGSTGGYLPMRRFGGKGLVVSAGTTHYDFADTWLPLTAQQRPRFTSEARIDTRPDGFDGAEPDCVWHRLLLDATIPPETGVRFLSRAANTREALATARWIEQPTPYRRPAGPELPWLRERLTRPRAPEDAGTYELLFQRTEGRYLQLRIELSGNERATPRLRALRLWYPRFSYSRHYLPAVYREAPEPASFLERFLANMEGMVTAIEDRISTVRALFHWDSAPAEALEWLAGWMAVTLDPAWDERRRRLFLKHAMTFFQYRGTAHGLRMALALADPGVCEAELGPPGTIPESRQRVRIVERFRKRLTPGLVIGEPLRDTGPREVEVGIRWTPAEGRGRLDERYRQWLKSGAVDDSAATFELIAPAARDENDATPELWWRFVRSALGFEPDAAAERSAWQRFAASTYRNVVADFNADFGTTAATFDDVVLPADLPPEGDARRAWRTFVDLRDPPATGHERRLWQDFLARRYHRIGALNDAWGTHWQGFDEVPLADRVPRDGPAQHDWHRFETVVKVMHRNAHRFAVLIPSPGPNADLQQLQERLALARRVVAMEQPAHTLFEVGYYWALFRAGEARLGFDTLLGPGSRSPDLMPALVLGEHFVGGSYLALSPVRATDQRLSLECLPVTA